MIVYHVRLSVRYSTKWHKSTIRSHFFKFICSSAQLFVLILSVNTYIIIRPERKCKRCAKVRMDQVEDLKNFNLE
jgi:hypothetical protein